MKTSRILMACLCMLSMLSCKKDGEDSENGARGSYTYAGTTVKLTGGSYHAADEQIYLFLDGENFETAQIIFVDAVSGNVPTGTFTYKGRFESGFDPAKNFWSGQVGKSGEPIGDELTGGTVTISGSGNSYTINFELKTANGEAKGNFSGPLSKR